MITDKEFWQEIRRKKSGGDTLFKFFLGVLHTREANLATGLDRSENVEQLFLPVGNEYQNENIHRNLAFDRKRRLAESVGLKLKEMMRMSNIPPKEATLQLPNTRYRLVSPITIRALQRILLFAVPIYNLQHKIHAMSLTASTSVFVEKLTNKIVRFGDGDEMGIPETIEGCEGCAAGEDFVAVLAGSPRKVCLLKATSPPDGIFTEDVLLPSSEAPVAMIASYGDRLSCLTQDKQMFLLSSNPYPNLPLLPCEYSQFIAVGPPPDMFTIGEDSILYRVGRTADAVRTPRRVLPFSNTPISRVAHGKFFMVVIDQCGKLLTCGRNRYGVLGRGSAQQLARLFRIRELASHFFVQVAAGEAHVLALTSSGVVYGSGSNAAGQLGMGSETDCCSVFTPIPLPGSCDGIAAGPRSSAFAMRNGTVYVCGEIQGLTFDDVLSNYALQHSSLSHSTDHNHKRQPNPSKAICRHVPTRLKEIQSGVVSYILHSAFPSEDLAAHLDEDREHVTYSEGDTFKSVESTPNNEYTGGKISETQRVRENGMKKFLPMKRKRMGKTRIFSANDESSKESQTAQDPNLSSVPDSLSPLVTSLSSDRFGISLVSETLLTQSQRSNDFPSAVAKSTDISQSKSREGRCHLEVKNTARPDVEVSSSLHSATAGVENNDDMIPVPLPLPIIDEKVLLQEESIPESFRHYSPSENRSPFRSTNERNDISSHLREPIRTERMTPSPKQSEKTPAKVMCCC